MVKENSNISESEKQTKGGWQDSFFLKDGSEDYWADGE